MKPFRRKDVPIIIICNTILMTTDSILDEAGTVQSLYLSNCFTCLPLPTSMSPASAELTWARFLRLPDVEDGFINHKQFSHNVLRD